MIENEQTAEPDPEPPTITPPARRVPAVAAFATVGVVVGVVAALLIPRLVSSGTTSGPPANAGASSVAATAATPSSAGGGPTRRLSGGRGIQGVLFSPDGHDVVALAAEGGMTLVWNAATGEPVATLATRARHFAVSPDGRTIAVDAFDQGPKVWDLATGKITAELKRAPSGDGMSALAFSPDGKVLAQVASEGDFPELHLWDVAKPNEVVSLVDPRLPHTNFNDVESVAYSPDGKTVAVGGEALYEDPVGTAQVILWDPATQTTVGHITAT
jgi:WD40 repeat protein